MASIVDQTGPSASSPRGIRATVRQTATPSGSVVAEPLANPPKRSATPGTRGPLEEARVDGDLHPVADDVDVMSGREIELVGRLGDRSDRDPGGPDDPAPDRHRQAVRAVRQPDQRDRAVNAPLASAGGQRRDGRHAADPSLATSRRPQRTVTLAGTDPESPVADVAPEVHGVADAVSVAIGVEDAPRLRSASDHQKVATSVEPVVRRWRRAGRPPPVRGADDDDRTARPVHVAPAVGIRPFGVTA